jgi:hypothetical protein
MKKPTYWWPVFYTIVSTALLVGKFGYGNELGFLGGFIIATTFYIWIGYGREWLDFWNWEINQQGYHYIDGELHWLVNKEQMAAIKRLQGFAEKLVK